MNLKKLIPLFIAAASVSCMQHQEMKLTVIDPGHFHGSLMMENRIEGISDTIRVFAPAGNELNAFLSNIRYYNSRENNPTSWVVDLYEGEDYLSALPESDGCSFVVLAGNNRLKSDYILQSVQKGYHVLSDKPMAINPENYKKLKKAYDIAGRNKLVIYDMMTERYDIQNVIARMLVSDKEVFGEPDGTVVIDDVHHFLRIRGGNPSIRPMWYFDVRQQGEGIADVTTHFIDLMLWQLYPQESITSDRVSVTKAVSYPTPISLDQYKLVTGAEAFPEYLSEDISDNVLNVYSNGSIEFEVDSQPFRVNIRWDYLAEPGGGDKFNEYIPGTKATLEIRQDRSTGFARKMYFTASELQKQKAEQKLHGKYPNIRFVPEGNDTYFIEIPDEYRCAYEDHFRQLSGNFLECVRKGRVPDWEKENTLSKYNITTTAVELAGNDR